MTIEIISLLSELAVLADRVERDERRILAAALERQEVTDDEEERRVLGRLSAGQGRHSVGLYASRWGVH